MSLPTTKQVLQKLLSLVLSPSTCSHSSVASGSKMVIMTSFRTGSASGLLAQVNSSWRESCGGKRKSIPLFVQGSGTKDLGWDGAVAAASEGCGMRRGSQMAVKPTARMRT